MEVKVVCTAEIKPDLVSRGVMLFQKTNYSHIFFVHGDFIYHADGHGVNKIPLTSYLKTHVIRKSFDVELKISDKEFEAFMEGEMEKEYSQSQYLGFLFKPLRRFVTNKGEKRICSELVAAVLQKYSAFKFTEELDFLSPLDVVKYLEAAAES